MNNPVRALMLCGNDLYAGGEFTLAGGKVSGYVARAHLASPSLSIFRSADDVLLCWPAFYSVMVLQDNFDLRNGDGWTNADVHLTTNGATKCGRVRIASRHRFFRLISPE
jgi:hypothetical protein